MARRAIVLTTAYMPPVDYVEAIASAELVLLEAHEHYQKQSYRNRAEVVGPNGVERLVVPVVRPGGAHTPIKEVAISYATRWVEQHLGALRACYGQSAFFIHYFPELERMVRQAWPSLWDLNLALLRFTLPSVKRRRSTPPTQRATCWICARLFTLSIPAPMAKATSKPLRIGMVSSPT